MSPDLIQGQLLFHLVRSPKQFSNQRLKATLFGAKFAPIFTLLRKQFIDENEVSLHGVAIMRECPEESSRIAMGLAELSEATISFKQCVDYLEDYHLRRQLSSICQDGHIWSQDKERPIQDTINAIAARAIGVGHGAAYTVVQGSNFQNIDKEIAEIGANPGMLKGPSTGFRKLDRIINGLYPRFYIIGARPSVGKTALVGDMIESLCEEQNPVLVYSLEMSADSYRKRQIAKMSGVNLDAYRSETLSKPEFAMICQSQARMKKWTWWIDDNPDATIDDIETTATSISRDYPGVIVVVDYLQLVSVRGVKDRYEAVGQISSRLKKLSARINSPVVALSQLKRADSRFDSSAKRTIKPKPQLDDLRESGNLEQDADVCLLLDRDPLENKESASLIVAKQRNGPTHEGIKMSYSPTVTKFKEDTL
jgi:replicative DNA helicase